MNTNRSSAVIGSQRAAVVDEWFVETLKSYPAETAQFLRRVADPFRNPAGHLLRQNLGVLFDTIALSDDWSAATRALHALMQLRAVQGFGAEAAVGFIGLLGPILTGAGGPGGAGRAGGAGLPAEAPPDTSAKARGAGLPAEAPPDTSAKAGGRNENSRDLDARLDRLKRLALDIYGQYCVRIEEVRSTEVSRRTWVLRRINAGKSRTKQ